MTREEEGRDACRKKSYKLPVDDVEVQDPALRPKSDVCLIRRSGGQSWPKLGELGCVGRKLKLKSAPTYVTPLEGPQVRQG